MIETPLWNIAVPPWSLNIFIFHLNDITVTATALRKSILHFLDIFPMRINGHIFKITLFNTVYLKAWPFRFFQPHKRVFPTQNNLQYEKIRMNWVRIYDYNAPAGIMFEGSFARLVYRHPLVSVFLNNLRFTYTFMFVFFMDVGGKRLKYFRCFHKRL